jgi:sulfonate transport system substrate-binding protein
MKPRNRTIGALFAITFACAAIGISVADERQLTPNAPLSELRIGYQKGGPLLILKSSGRLDERLAPLGVHVRWAEFPSGPPLLEALNAGALDFGVAGNAATVFAQGAADSQLVYVATEIPSSHGEAVLVPADSKLRTLADLKGKTVAFTRASNAHFLLIRALESAHLSLGDIRQANLSPTDARAALESGSVDAWVIWDPFYADAQLNLKARVLADASGLVDDLVFYLSTRPFAEKHGRILETVIDEIEKTDQWMQAHPVDAARQLADATGLPLNIWQTSISRHNYGIHPVVQKTIDAQQSIADAFFSLGLLPAKENVASAVLCNGHPRSEDLVLCRENSGGPAK